MSVNAHQLTPEKQLNMQSYNNQSHFVQNHQLRYINNSIAKNSEILDLGSGFDSKDVKFAARACTRRMPVR